MYCYRAPVPPSLVWNFVRRSTLTPMMIPQTNSDSSRHRQGSDEHGNAP